MPFLGGLPFIDGLSQYDFHRNGGRLTERRSIWPCVAVPAAIICIFDSERYIHVYSRSLTVDVQKTQEREVVKKDQATQSRVRAISKLSIRFDLLLPLEKPDPFVSTTE